jgi:hypothetical protein
MKFVAFTALEGAETWIRPDRVQYLKRAAISHEGRMIMATSIVLISETPSWINVDLPISAVARALQDAS